VEHLTRAGRYTPPADGHHPNSYVEHIRSAALSLGTYSIPAGGLDDQVPHAEDEVYVVLAGRAAFTGAGTMVPVGPGSVLSVPAGEEHRFQDVTEDLAVLVVFAPPYSGRAG
jgi:mannose-6-phosphate isomerase-like protein (cupin superfamily)